MKLDEIIEKIGVEPYYREDAGVIYNADCLDILPKMPEKCVDLVVTDIPFNIGWKYGIYHDNLSDNDYYDNCIRWFSAIKSVAHKAIIKIPTKFSYIVIPAFHKTLGYKWTIIQHSPNTTSHGPFNLNLYTQYLVSKGKWNNPNTDFFVNTKNNLESNHPAEMPTRPIKVLLNWFANENDIILDPLAGSGTTIKACRELRFQHIGIEIEKKYCDIAVQRLAQEILI